MKSIRYRAGYKYQLHDKYWIQTVIRPIRGFGGNDFVSISSGGILMIAPGYAWDGASGPALDTDTIMRASLVHDSLYQLIRMGVLHEVDRAAADQLLRDIALEDGMWPARSWWIFKGVRLFGSAAAAPAADKILVAPSPAPEMH